MAYHFDYDAWYVVDGPNHLRFPMHEFTPKEVRDLIDGLRLRQLRLDHTFEQYEATVVNTQIPIDKKEWLQHLTMLRQKNRVSRDNLRRRLALLEGILTEDEAANGWKGEDRFVEGLVI